jgi:hypothetical protein
MSIGESKLQLILLLVVITIIWIAYEIYLLPKGRYTIETDFASWKTDAYTITDDGIVFKTHLGEEIEIRSRYTIKDSEDR